MWFLIACQRSNSGFSPFIALMAPIQVFEIQNGSVNINAQIFTIVWHVIVIQNPVFLDVYIILLVTPFNRKRRRVW